MKRLLKSFAYAWNGLLFVVKNEANMQIHLVAALITIVLSIYVGIALWEWAIILLAMMAVMSSEIMNTIIEKYLDFYHPERNNKIMVLKDMAAAYVLITAFFAFLIALIIFVPKVKFALWLPL